MKFWKTDLLHPPVVLDTPKAASIVNEENNERSNKEEADKSESSIVIKEDSTLKENSEVEVTEAQSDSRSRSQPQ